ncbi:phage tail assembly chaperone G [Clostridium sporogenes]
MEITLKIDDNDKIFIAPFVSTRKLKETLVLSKKVQNGFDEKVLDELGNYIVGLYGNQFTLDELLDGFPANKFFGKAIEDLQTVVGNFDDKVKN